MSDLQRNFAHWRKVFIRINLGIALAITAVEIAMSIILYFQHLIFEETLAEYIIEYIVQPNVVIWGGMLLLWIVFMVANKNQELLQSRQGPKYECGSLYDELLNGALLLMLTLSCGTVAYVHYIFRVTVAGLCIPIFLSIIFYSRKICIQTIILSELMIAVAVIHRYNRSFLDGPDPYIVEDVVIIMLLMLAIGIIALNLIKQMKAQHEQMVEAREAAEIANRA